MQCNENVIKNMANEITRNCQAHNVNVDPVFVIYLIDLLLLNPKYGKLFNKTINRNNLAYFVKQCVEMINRGGTALNTLKIQFIIQTNYDQLSNLTDRYHDNIQNCLRPLLNEIVNADPDPANVSELQKFFRKLSIYFIIESGLGNAEYIFNLKEGLAALESVLHMDDLKTIISLPRIEKIDELKHIMGLVSGVRLFNRNCKKGGEGIQDLPSSLVEAGKTCMTSLSKTLIAVVQKVNSLTVAISDTIVIQNETGNVIIDVTKHPGVTIPDCKEILDLLAFYRQYEVYIRKLLADIEYMMQRSVYYVDKVKTVMDDLHAAVKYKDAVPVQNVFPLFKKLWKLWAAMQDIMYLVSTVNRLLAILNGIQERIILPQNVLKVMLKEKTVMSDHKNEVKPSTKERLSLAYLHNYVANPESGTRTKVVTEFLGFCALCLSVGALVPSNPKIGFIKFQNRYYGFCNVQMVVRFGHDPERYINEVLDCARNNPQLINLLNLMENVYEVKDVDDLVKIRVPTTMAMEKGVQTVTHPYDRFKPSSYTSNIWKWRRRACQWASIVNSQTHSTQTNYSHLRSDVECQTFEPRDKCLQTNKDTSTNTISRMNFIWGLRGQSGLGQHYMDLTQTHQLPAKAKVHTVTACSWPCIGKKEESMESILSDDFADFYTSSFLYK